MLNILQKFFYHEVSDEWNFYVGIFVRYFGTWERGKKSHNFLYIQTCNASSFHFNYFIMNKSLTFGMKFSPLLLHVVVAQTLLIFPFKTVWLKRHSDIVTFIRKFTNVILSRMIIKLIFKAFPFAIYTMLSSKNAFKVTISHMKFHARLPRVSLHKHTHFASHFKCNVS